jgi:hypothetical protein
MPIPFASAGQTLIVPGTGETVSATVSQGDHTISAIGTYDYGDGPADAKCHTSTILGSGWADAYPHANPLLEIVIDDEGVAWSASGGEACDANWHAYDTVRSCPTSVCVWRFRILDAGPVPYSDNSGSLSVVIDSVVTDEVLAALCELDGFGLAESDVVAIALCGDARCTEGDLYTGLCAAVSATGDASGHSLAVAPQGHASTQMDCLQCLAVGASAEGATAVATRSASGGMVGVAGESAQGQALAVSGTRDATCTFTLACVALSGPDGQATCGPGGYRPAYFVCLSLLH